MSAVLSPHGGKSEWGGVKGEGGGCVTLLKDCEAGEKQKKPWHRQPIINESLWKCYIISVVLVTMVALVTMVVLVTKVALVNQQKSLEALHYLSLCHDNGLSTENHLFIYEGVNEDVALQPGSLSCQG